MILSGSGSAGDKASLSLQKTNEAPDQGASFVSSVFLPFRTGREQLSDIQVWIPSFGRTQRLRMNQAATTPSKKSKSMAHLHKYEKQYTLKMARKQALSDFEPGWIKAY